MDWGTLGAEVDVVAKLVQEAGYAPDIIVGIVRGGMIPAVSTVVSPFSSPSQPPPSVGHLLMTCMVSLLHTLLRTLLHPSLATPPNGN